VDRWSELLGRPLEDLEPMTQMLADAGHAMTATGLMAAQEVTSVWCRSVEAWWGSDGDLLLTPTMTCVPPPLGRLSPDGDLGEVATGLGRLTPFTMPFDVTGQPAVSLPLAWSADGLPIGVQLVAAKGGEDTLIRIASQLEQAHPWAGRVPAVHG
jgi:amidase